MSQTDALRELFQVNNNTLTLSQISDSWRTVGLKYTCRISELRDSLEKSGLTIHCDENRDDPMNNRYTIMRTFRGELFK